MSGFIEGLQGFAISCIMIGWCCIVGGLILYGLTDIAQALIARHS